MSSQTPPPAFNGPSYVLGSQPYKVRAQKIVAQNDSSEPSCTVCISKNQACYRHPDYAKCAYCTAREFTKPFCHLPGEPDPLPTRRPKRKRSLTPCIEDGPQAADTVRPVQGLDLSIPGGPVPDVLATETARLRGTIAAQGASIEQLSEALERLADRVNILEGSTSRACTSSHTFERPITTRPANARRPRRLDPSVIETLPISPPYDPSFQTSCTAPDNHLPPSPSRPVGYQPPYTDISEDNSNGAFPGHTLCHVAGFTPINCSCALPHTLKNGDTRFPRDGFT